MAMAKHKLYVGDNTTVLDKLILEGIKVDMIYIDPTFHANNKFFKKYRDDEKEWLTTLMYKLQKSRILLKDDGLIFISIGDDQVCKLKLVCDKIFGERNKIAMMAVKTPNQTEGKNVIKNTEYLLIYGNSERSELSHPSKRQEGRCTTGREGQTIQTIIIPKGTRVEKVADGEYTNDDILKTGGNEDIELVGNPIIVKNGKLHRAIKLRCRWSCPNDVRNFISAQKKESNSIVRNKYGKEILELYLKGMRFQPWLVKEGFDKPPTFIDSYISKGKNNLTDVIGKHDFSYPKSVDFIKFVVAIGTHSNDAVVLDYYAGSGTTLQAVAEYNDDQGKNISTILVTNNENDIAEKITIPRIKTLQTGIRPDGSKYSDGLNFDFETEYVELDDIDFGLPD